MIKASLTKKIIIMMTKPQETNQAFWNLNQVDIVCVRSTWLLTGICCLSFSTNRL